MVYRSKLVFLLSCLGNLLGHYDSAIYSFFAPVLAKTFLDIQDQSTSLLVIYALIYSSMIIKCFGTVFFASLISKYKVKTIFSVTLLGISISTGLLALIPGYQSIGILAPLLLLTLRMLQGFFHAGEHTISSIFVLSLATPDNRAKVNSYYQASSMLGILLASVFATITMGSEHLERYWRIAFFFSFFTSIVGFWLRSKKLVNFDSLSSDSIKKASQLGTLNLIKPNLITVIQIALLNSFGYLTYCLPFFLINQLLPILSSDISTVSLLTSGNFLIIIDIVMLFVVGLVIDLYDYKKVLIVLVVLFSVTVIPFFAVLQTLTYLQLFLLKLWIILIGVCFCVTLNAWLYKKLSGIERYVLIGLGYTLGTEIFGHQTPVIFLFLLKYFGNLIVPALYLLALCLMLLLCLVSLDKRNKNNITLLKK